MACDITYLTASYRGLPFRIMDSTDTFGRRGESYEYPNSEQPGYIDLGRKARKYKITGYSNGESHLLEANEMALAAEQTGPGILIHPFLGGLSVVCVSLEISHEYIEKKRYSKYVFDLLEPGFDVTSFVPLGSLFDQLLSIIPEITETLISSVDGVFSSSGLILEQVVSEVQFTGRLISDNLLGIDNTRFFDTFGKLERVSSSEAVARSEPFGRLFQETMGNISSSGPRTIGSGASFDRLIRISDGLRKSVPSTTGLEKPLNSLYGTTRVGAVMNASLMTRGKEYATLFEALRDLDKMVRVLDNEAQISIRLDNTVLYSQIVKLRALIIEDMIRTNIGKPGVVFKTRAGQLPSLVLSYELYADAKRAVELEKYNPGFSPWALGESFWSAAR